jgi:hypothetical protein
MLFDVPDVSVETCLEVLLFDAGVSNLAVTRVR